MTVGLVHPSYNLPKGQGGKSIFFEPWILTDMVKPFNELSQCFLAAIEKYEGNKKSLA